MRIEERERLKAAQRERERKQRRLAQLEIEIAAAEKALVNLNETLAADHGGEWQKLHSLVADREKTEKLLNSHLAEWEKLGAEIERDDRMSPQASHSRTAEQARS